MCVKEKAKELESGFCFFFSSSSYNIKHIFYLSTLYLKSTHVLENTLYLYSFYTLKCFDVYYFILSKHQGMFGRKELLNSGKLIDIHGLIDR